MALMYMSILVSTQQGINNFTLFRLTLEYPGYPSFTNYTLEINIIFQKYDEVDNDLHILTSDTVYDHYNEPFGLVFTDLSETTFKDTIQL